METASGITQNQQVQNVTPTSETNKDEKTEQGGKEFAEFLKGVLKPDAANQVSEEALFAGIVQQRVSALKGEEDAKGFTDLVNKHRSAMTGANGYVSEEDAAKAALKEFQSSGKITAEEASKIYTESFDAAQLDDKTDALFDHLGGAGDPTMAMAALDTALKLAQEKLDGMDTAKISVSLRDLNEASTGWSYKNPGAASAGAGSSSSGANGLTPNADGVIEPNGNFFDGSGGFLFKPITNNENKLAVILPDEFLDKVESVVLKDSAGNILDEGRFTSNGDNGTNPKYAFNKQGGEYGSNITVEVTTSDGGVVSYAIADPSKRYD